MRQIEWKSGRPASGKPHPLVRTIADENFSRFSVAALVDIHRLFSDASIGVLPAPSRLTARRFSSSRRPRRNHARDPQLAAWQVHGRSRAAVPRHLFIFYASGDQSIAMEACCSRHAACRPLARVMSTRRGCWSVVLSGAFKFLQMGFNEVPRCFHMLLVQLPRGMGVAAVQGIEDLFMFPLCL